MMTRQRAMMSDSEWDEVWRAYDARNPAPPAPSRAPAPSLPPRPRFTAAAARPRGASRRGWRLARGLAWLGLPLVALVGVGTPYAAAWQVATALEGRDHATLARHIDHGAVQGALRAALKPGPVAEAGDQAGAFLAAMAEDIAAAWATPAALAEVAQARGVRAGAPVEAMRRAMPVGLTKFELALHGAASPITLQLELKPEGLASRWQVTGVRLDPAAPAAGPGPALRLSAMR
jgi:hypothetical protein